MVGRALTPNGPAGVVGALAANRQLVAQPRNAAFVCGSPATCDNRPYLAIEDIDHIRTKAKPPQTNAVMI